MKDLPKYQNRYHDRDRYARLTVNPWGKVVVHGFPKKGVFKICPPNAPPDRPSCLWPTYHLMISLGPEHSHEAFATEAVQNCITTMLRHASMLQSRLNRAESALFFDVCKNCRHERGRAKLHASFDCWRHDLFPQICNTKLQQIKEKCNIVTISLFWLGKVTQLGRLYERGRAKLHK